MAGDDFGRFRDFYATVEAPAVRELEQRVLGTDYGANSYTDIAQAERLGDLVKLAPGSLLLDIGSGAGWPGLYLATRSGCRVVLTDVPAEGLRAAAARARRDGVDAAPIRAAGERLPFRDAMFDAVTHSDVLCWLADKLSVLRASARVLKPGGRLAFFVIRDQPGLSTAGRERAAELDPGYVVTDAPYRHVLTEAGFTAITEEDVTAGYREVASRWLTEAATLEPDLRAAMGDAVFEDKQSRRHDMIAAMDEGLIGRALFTAQA